MAQPAQVPEPVTDAGAILGVIATALAVAGAIWAMLGGKRHLAERRANREFQRQFREDWIGVPERPGVPGRPGVMATLLEFRGDWQGLSDRIRRAETDLLRMRSELTILHNRMAAVERTCPQPDAETEEG